MFIAQWVLWVAIILIALVIELNTEGFFIMWFGIAAIVPAIMGFFGVPFHIQFLAYILGIIILLILTQKILKKFVIKETKEEQLGGNRMNGKQGIVLERINNKENIGMVRVERETWRAESFDDREIQENKKVSIVKIDGTHLIVMEVQ